MVAVAILETPPTRSVRHPPSLPRPGLGPLPPGAAAVMGLADASCRWPVGEVAEEGFGFCGAARCRGAYCADHRRLAYAGIAR